MCGNKATASNDPITCGVKISAVDFIVPNCMPAWLYKRVSGMRPAKETPANTLAGILVMPITRLTIGNGTNGTSLREKRYHAPSLSRPFCIIVSCVGNFFLIRGPRIDLESANGNIAPRIVVGREISAVGRKPNSAAPAIVTIPGGGKPMTADAKRTTIKANIAKVGLES